MHQLIDLSLNLVVRLRKWFFLLCQWVDCSWSWLSLFSWHRQVIHTTVQYFCDRGERQYCYLLTSPGPLSFQMLCFRSKNLLKVIFAYSLFSPSKINHSSLLVKLIFRANLSFTYLTQSIYKQDKVLFENQCKSKFKWIQKILRLFWSSNDVSSFPFIPHGCTSSNVVIFSIKNNVRVNFLYKAKSKNSFSLISHMDLLWCTKIQLHLF